MNEDKREEKNPVDEMLLSSDVSKKLKVCERTINNVIHRERDPLPAYMIGTVYRIKEDEYSKWLERQKVKKRN